MILDRLYEQGVQKKEKGAISWPCEMQAVCTNNCDRSYSDITWLMIHLFSLIIPLLLNLTMIYATFIMFIPIMGRSGSAINPDLLIGCLTVAMTLATIRLDGEHAQRNFSVLDPLIASTIIFFFRFSFLFQLPLSPSDGDREAFPCDDDPLSYYADHDGPGVHHPTRLSLLGREGQPGAPQGLRAAHGERDL